jgi:hypothetical protein
MKNLRKRIDELFKFENLNEIIKRILFIVPE